MLIDNQQAMKTLIQLFLVNYKVIKTYKREDKTDTLSQFFNIFSNSKHYTTFLLNKGDKSIKTWVEFYEDEVKEAKALQDNNSKAKNYFDFLNLHKLIFQSVYDLVN